ncbi:MAG: acyl-CoA/acyl-ACP dehydrogenase [Chloroflexi bacterium]|nr:acyl-CoA/acyl-ACP dehydrogenase [Chloroflexota bacterium]
MQVDFTLTKEQEDLKKRAHEFALAFRPHVAEWDAANHCPLEEVTQAARKAGLLGITMPKEYGGKDLSVMDYVVAHEEVNRTGQWATLGEPMFSTSGPGPTILLRSENGALKKKFLADIITGEKRCAVAITEPMYGSNIDDLETAAEEKSGHFVVNGSKRFITGATDNELYATFVRFKNIPGSKGVGVLMIQAGSPGVTILPGPVFVGTRGQPHGELLFENAVIPKENLMWREGNFARVMECFNMERVHNATMSLATAEAALDEALKYTQTRKAFGKFICEFQAVYQDLAEIATLIEATRGLVYRAACTAIDGKYPLLIEATMAKLYASEVVRKVTEMAMTLHGGDGTTMDFPIQRLWREGPIATVGGGSPAILRNMIARKLLNRRLDQH